MVKRMNKKEFINELSNQLSYSKEQCLLISDILEDNFFISKSNKDKIIESFVETLHIEKEAAKKVYDIVATIIKEEIKYKAVIE